VTRGKNLDVFVVGNDNAIYYKFWNFVWSGWLNIGGNCSSAPAVASWGDNQLDVFVRSQKDELMHKSWSKNLGWSEWKNRSQTGMIKSAPAAVSWGEKTIDVFAVGPNSEMLHISFDGNKWSNWGSLEGNITSAPSAVSTVEGKVMVFARNKDRVLIENHLEGKKWSGWSLVAGGAVVIPDQ
jgi:hypothetical protein